MLPARRPPGRGSDRGWRKTVAGSGWCSSASARPCAAEGTRRAGGALGDVPRDAAAGIGRLRSTTPAPVPWRSQLGDVEADGGQRGGGHHRCRWSPAAGRGRALVRAPLMPRAVMACRPLPGPGGQARRRRHPPRRSRGPCRRPGSPRSWRWSSCREGRGGVARDVVAGRRAAVTGGQRGRGPRGCRRSHDRVASVDVHRRGGRDVPGAVRCDGSQRVRARRSPTWCPSWWLTAKWSRRCRGWRCRA